LNIYPPIGFHGDKYLLKLVEYLAKQSEVFIETGTNIGSTLRYTATDYPHLRCFSCEPDHKQCHSAVQNTKHLNNVKVFRLTSQKFLPDLVKCNSDIVDKDCLFWLDAHGRNFQWPLKFEIDFIANNFVSANILIDDFQVPWNKRFGYDVYKNQKCCFEFIKSSINRKYNLYYPAYTEHTSKYHPLRGWGLIQFGKLNHGIIEDLPEIVKK